MSALLSYDAYSTMAAAIFCYAALISCRRALRLPLALAVAY